MFHHLTHISAHFVTLYSLNNVHYFMVYKCCWDKSPSCKTFTLIQSSVGATFCYSPKLYFYHYLDYFNFFCLLSLCLIQNRKIIICFAQISATVFSQTPPIGAENLCRKSASFELIDLINCHLEISLWPKDASRNASSMLK